MIKDIIVFYRNPYSYFNAGGNETMREKVLFFKKTYIFCLYSAIIIIFIIIPIDTTLKSKFNISIYENLFKNRNEARAINSHFRAFLDTCLISPFEEEVLFRLILITSSYFLRLTLFLLFAKAIVPENQINISPFIWNTILSLIFVTVMVFNKESTQDDPHDPPIFKKKSYNYLCWGMTIAFALAHINNFAPLNWSIIYLYPFYVLPQFVYGVVLSFLTIRYNSIVWPFLLHVAINSTAEIYGLLRVIF